MRLLILGLAASFMVILGVCFGIAGVYGEIKKESACQKQWGEGWEAHYEQQFRLTVQEARFKVGFTVVALVVIGVLLVKMVKHLADADPRRRARQNPGRRVRPNPHARESREQRVRRLRRNAMLWCGLGVGGIIAGASMVVFYPPTHAESDSWVMSLTLFLVGYSGIISGCGYWLKAKGGNENLTVIGLAPLLVLLVPFVRIFALRAIVQYPMSALAVMLFFSVLLLAVVATLPDRSGVSQR